MSDNPWVILAENSVLETDRLRLRPLTLADLADYQEFNMDDDLLKYNYQASKTETESLEALVIWNMKEPLGRYGIELVSEGKIIGNSSIYLSDDLTTATLGITLNRHYHGQGYARETMTALRDLVASMPTVQLLRATCDERNQASRKVLESIGLRLRERCENVTSLRGNQITSLVYALDLAERQEEKD